MIKAKELFPVRDNVLHLEQNITLEDRTDVTAFLHCYLYDGKELVLRDVISDDEYRFHVDNSTELQNIMDMLDYRMSVEYLEYIWMNIGYSAERN